MVYGLYKEADKLVETNGNMSLNLRPGCVHAIGTLMALGVGDRVLWLGSGNGPEMISLALLHPQVTFIGIERQRGAVEVTQRKIMELQQRGYPLRNITMHVCDIMDGWCGNGHTHVYTIAMEGPCFYQQVRALARGCRAVMFKEIWHGDIPPNSSARTVFFSGPGGRRQLVAAYVPRTSGREA